MLKGIMLTVAYGFRVKTSDSIFEDLSLPLFRALFMHTVMLQLYLTFKIPDVVFQNLRKLAPYATPRMNRHLGNALLFIPILHTDLTTSPLF